MLFQGFANVWTPVAFATQLVGDLPLGVTVAGEKVVLFRSRGQLAALMDRCPHRGVALSLGRVREGCIECPFHGWRFDAAGKCEHVPWNPDTPRARLGARVVPSRERGGLLWVYTREGPDAPSEPELPTELLRGGVRLSGETFRWSAHWTRVVENMLDDSHLPFVHAKTIGRATPKPRTRLDLHLEEQPWGWSWRTSMDGEIQGQVAEFRWPNTMLLRIPVPGKLLAIHLTAIPESATSVRILQLSARDFLPWRLLDGIFHRINRQVLLEDRVIVESSPSEVPPVREERSVRTDALSLLFRKRYFRELSGSGSDLLSIGAPRARPAGS